jgi:hypothetical protein
LPERVARMVMYPELRKRREEEVAKLEGGKKSS